MDMLGKLVQGGCAADGTVAARNPMTQALDGMLRAGPLGRAAPMGPSQDGGHFMEHDLRQAMDDAQHQQHLQEAHFRQHQMAMRNDASMHQPSPMQMDALWQQQQQAPQRMHDSMQRHAHMEGAFADAGTVHPQASQSHHGMHHQASAGHHPMYAMPPPPMMMMHAPRPYMMQNTTHMMAPTYAPQAPVATAAPAPVTHASSDAQRISSEMAQALQQDPRFEKSEFLKFMNQVSTGDVELHEASNSVIHHTAEPVTEGINLLEPVSGAEVLDDVWHDAAAGNDTLEEIWAKAMQEAQMQDPFDDTALWSSQQHNHTYDFQEENPFEHDANAFEMGCRFFAEGQLKDAILAFEASLQESPDHSEAWRMLGECHAENDEDKKAITCLNRAVEEDPYNLHALLALGVSNVNELNSHGALETLQAWVQHNPKFHGLQVHVSEDMYGDGSLMDQVMQLMLQAQSHDPLDSDVQVVLGVLYNVSKDYDAAVRCFRLAASARPDEYALWNKLGATLANSSRSSEAIPTYHRALEIKPKYARGWLNLGISHANLGQYEEAAKCYLQALHQNNQAEHIWSYLRIAFTCLERFDLVKMTDMKDVMSFQHEFPIMEL
ncbi:hypothetical protein SPRG_13424 [Saprolegnia parasitica CBS 223.65]|uniref:Uncharacterized protein n=1 Tax=Saprolegnia parasitica (strain CBS 223.65) TaxID=695850 RepID=A0A067C1N4_SAPPC|nr:hypothetical protein SPRG_13424 [Saprolegnia parasitica CBS 223.65]KDO20672.1 hypothetical protein SPRG_13424 [Saprolegnia parasitica CBS 223.65]|eukprot:XP_012208637.1 hypothetical protein SPRG_13424 [Saprolegnia parasitica CBS 223.65]